MVGIKGGFLRLLLVERGRKLSLVWRLERSGKFDGFCVLLFLRLDNGDDGSLDGDIDGNQSMMIVRGKMGL
jgi:hypothetical protein